MEGHSLDKFCSWRVLIVNESEVHVWQIFEQIKSVRSGTWLSSHLTWKHKEHLNWTISCKCLYYTTMKLKHVQLEVNRANLYNFFTEEILIKWEKKQINSTTRANRTLFFWPPSVPCCKVLPLCSFNRAENCFQFGAS